MQTAAIIGAQWGDEGKGKLTDLLAAKSDLVVRYQGGANAGHTIWVGPKKYVLHLIPSGILHGHTTSIIGHGVVFDPIAFAQELAMLTQEGFNLGSQNLAISPQASVITSYHRLLDQVREQQGSTKIGTTGRGIGPCYEDKVGRKGIVIQDLFDLPTLQDKLAASLKEKAVLFQELYNTGFPSVEEEASVLYKYGQQVKPFVTDTFGLISEAYQVGKKILFEGAQGLLLDLDYGTYPFVTSSHPSYGGIYTGAGLPGKIDEVIGVVKAYSTRVGEGPFPTELFDEQGEKIRQNGREFGSTTGRPRRTGWLDLPLLKYAVKVSRISSIALTKVDVLTNLPLKICTAYRYQGKVIDQVSPGMDLSKAQPIYEDFAPFKDSGQEDPSRELMTYLEMIEQSLQVPIGIIAYGPERNQIRWAKDYF